MKDQLFLAFLVGVGGFIGAISRYGLGSFIQERSGDFPAGTFVVNFLGCFLLSIIMFGATQKDVLSEEARLFLGVGVMGAFTTMSTFSYETMKLVEDNKLPLAGANVLLTVTLMLAAIYLGKLAAEGLWN